MKKGPQRQFVLPKFYTNRGNLKTRWYIEFQAINDSTGKLKLKRIVCPSKFKTKKEREAWSKEVINEITGLLVNGYQFMQEDSLAANQKELNLFSGMLIKDLLHTINIIKPTLRPKSVITYMSSINKLSDYVSKTFPDGDIGCKEFTSKQSIVFRDYLINDLKNSPRTANNTFMHLRTVYAQYKSRSDAPESPFVLKKLKTIATNKNISFTKKDQIAIEEYLQQHEPDLYILTRFIYYAFIRPGELNNLKVSTLDLHQGNIRIPGDVSKSGKLETIPIIRPLREIIVAMDLSNSNNYLFGKNLKTGKYLSGKQVAFRRHEKVIEKLGLKDKGYTLYSWKHTGAVNAYLAGMGIKELQRFLRHSSIQITDIYLKSLGLRTDPKINEYNW